VLIDLYGIMHRLLLRRRIAPFAEPNVTHTRLLQSVMLGLCLSVLASSASAAKSPYIVVYKDHQHKQEAMGRHGNLAFRRDLSIIPASAGELDPNEVAELQSDPDVAYVEPDYRYHVLGQPVAAADIGATGDVSAQSGSQVTPYGVSLVNAPAVWPKTRGAGVKVAVLDTGIAMYHPDRGNVVLTASFVSGETVEDFDGHGTHTSGSVAAADNGIGVIGVAPDAELLIGKVLDNTGSGYTSDIILGIQWAVANGAKVISMSFGGSDNSTAFQTACSDAANAGVLLVAAAGNNSSSTPFYPAAFSSVLAVSALDSSKAFASSFSNYGSDIALCAPGVSVYSTVALDSTATASAVWSSASHQANPITGTAPGTVSGQVCDCGLGTGTGSNTCPPAVAGNIALIKRGTNTFAAKVAYARSMGAVGAIIWNSSNGNFSGTLGDGTPLVAVAISKSDGTALQGLVPGGVTATIAVNGTLYAYYDGTSMACPHVSGLAALVFAASGINTPASEVRSILQNSAQDLGLAGWDQYYGYGLPNVSAAFGLVTPHNCSAVWVMGQGLAGDLDRDCVVYFKDMELLAAQWLAACDSTNAWCSGADLSQLGTVDFRDFAPLASDWLICNDPTAASCI
jgi:serine protease